VLGRPKSIGSVEPKRGSWRSFDLGIAPKAHATAAGSDRQTNA